MTKQGLSATAVLIASLGLTGCASLIDGNKQVVSVQTISKGQPVVGAACRLVNSKGTFFVTTPGTVTLQRAYGALSATCEKDGAVPGIASFQSSTKAMAFGNIIFGGVIGAAVDVGTGAAYDYPALLTIDMGEMANKAISAVASETQPAGTSPATASAQ